jgi:hypothetical protein
VLHFLLRTRPSYNAPPLALCQEPWASVSPTRIHDWLSSPPRAPSPGQEWPSTCLLNVGQAHENFTDLEGASAAEFLPVACGVSGYIPDDTEWARNGDYFGAP